MMLKYEMNKILSATLFVICFASCSAYAKSYSLPVVYSDNYINIRSSVLFSEEESFHLGDLLHLGISLEFDADRVRISNLDETLLTESWSESPWVAHHGSPQVTRSELKNGLTQLQAFYAFQIIDCPSVGVQCPGGKAYAMNDITLGVDLIDDNGRVVSTTDVNFRPSPGFVGLPSALMLNNGKLESFNLYFPGRAFGLPIPASVNPNPSLLLFIIGLILVSIMVVAPTARSWLRHRVTAQIGILGNRWEHVLDHLQDDKLENDEFWEGIRVAIIWYCYDEFKINPVHWSEANDKTDGDLEHLKTLYIQATQGTEQSSEQRKEIVNQLTESFKQS
jgi:hypothetical protein